MANRLERGAEAILLPDDLRWTDEFAWRAVQESKEYSSTGALVVDREIKQAGRPITLQSYEDFAGVMLLSDVRTIHQWSLSPTTRMRLTLRGSNYEVIFNCEKEPIEAEPFVDYSDPADTDYFKVKLAFLEVGSATVLSAPNQTGGQA